AGFDWSAIRVWDAATGKEVWRSAQTSSGFALAFSPSGRILASTDFEFKTLPNGDTTEEDTIHLWELTSGQEVRRIAGHPGYTWSLAFAPDGRTLASGGGDSTILFWDLTGRMKDGRLQPAPLTAKELDKLWGDLSGDASKAYRVVWTLAASPKQALLLLKERLRPTAAPDRQRIAKLIADLDDKQFTVRAKAAEEIAKLGELAEPALRKALEKQPSPEVVRSAQKLLDALAGPVTSGDALRAIRAVEVLEHIGTPEGRELLQALAKGAPEARLTQEAKASLERLKNQTPAP
ncbi:MAG TPA: hypothetical protein VKI65_00920, partial [Gemmataceae bacterium]|nr:hypothetical protein [Gemmataceae bacterium]